MVRLNVLKLTNTRLQALATILLHGRIQKCRLLDEHSKHIRPVDDRPASKISQPKHVLHRTRQRSNSMVELECWRQTLVPLDKLSIEVCRDGIQSCRACDGGCLRIDCIADTIEKPPKLDFRVEVSKVIDTRRGISYLFKGRRQAHMILELHDA